ncbi:MAG: hypothetical protein ABR503_12905 [Chitinophagaceae bacterium]
MLSTLTAYFLKNKKLYIPGFGNFRLIEHSATLDFADRLINPPYYKISFSEKEEWDENQINFICENDGVNANEAEQQLLEFGQELNHQIRQSSLIWKGVGRFEYLNDKFVFHPVEKNILLPVTANKVFRENAHHAVLVGEQEMQSNNMHEVQHITAKKTSYVILIALIILILAVLFIAYRFYSRGFTTGAAGLS